MASRRKQEQSTRPPARQGDGDRTTRSGRPDPKNVPSHSDEHKSGYGGELGEPSTSTDQRETPKRA